jgi:hypothetical protein
MMNFPRVSCKKKASIQGQSAGEIENGVRLAICAFSFCTDKLLLNRKRCADSYDKGLRGT